MTQVQHLMGKHVVSCLEGDSLDRAAQIMWENDCGAVPVVDGSGRVTGMVTDRDICMAAYTQGRSLKEISVSTASAKGLLSIAPGDSVERAEQIMARGQVRRLPVINADGRLVGLISVSDVARHLALLSSDRKNAGLSARDVALVFQAISQPRARRSTALVAPQNSHVTTTS